MSEWMTLEIVDLLPDKNSESEFDNYNNLRGLRTVVAASLQAADSPPLRAKGVVEWMMPTFIGNVGAPLMMVMW